MEANNPAMIEIKAEVVQDNESEEMDETCNEEINDDGNMLEQSDIMAVAADLKADLMAADEIEDSSQKLDILRHCFESFMETVAFELTKQQALIARLYSGKLKKRIIHPSVFTGIPVPQVTEQQPVTARLSSAESKGLIGDPLAVSWKNPAKNECSSSGIPVSVGCVNISSFNDVLSFSFSTNFLLKDVTFVSMCQAFYYIRLMCLGNADLACRIRLTSDQAQVMKIAGSMLDNKETEELWERNAKSVFHYVCAEYVRQVPEFLQALRVHGIGTKYYDSASRSPFWGCNTPSSKNQYGVWLSEFADLILTNQPLLVVPDYLLMPLEWDETKPEGSHLLIMSDNQLLGAVSGSASTHFVLIDKLTAKLRPELGYVSLKTEMEKLHYLSDTYCIVLATTWKDITRHSKEIKNMYNGLLTWLQGQTNAIIYILNGFPRLLNSSQDASVKDGNHVMKNVCNRFHNRVRLVDVYTALVPSVRGKDGDRFFNSGGSYLTPFGRARLATMLVQKLPICHLHLTEDMLSSMYSKLRNPISFEKWKQLQNGLITANEDTVVNQSAKKARWDATPSTSASQVGHFNQKDNRSTNISSQAEYGGISMIQDDVARPQQQQTGYTMNWQLPFSGPDTSRLSSYSTSMTRSFGDSQQMPYIDPVSMMQEMSASGAGASVGETTVGSSYVSGSLLSRSPASGLGVTAPPTSVGQVGYFSRNSGGNNSRTISQAEYGETSMVHDVMRFQQQDAEHATHLPSSLLGPDTSRVSSYSPSMLGSFGNPPNQVPSIDTLRSIMREITARGAGASVGDQTTIGPSSVRRSLLESPPIPDSVPMASSSFDTYGLSSGISGAGEYDEELNISGNSRYLL